MQKGSDAKKEPDSGSGVTPEVKQQPASQPSQKTNKAPKGSKAAPVINWQALSALLIAAGSLAAVVYLYSAVNGELQSKSTQLQSLQTSQAGMDKELSLLRLRLQSTEQAMAAEEPRWKEIAAIKASLEEINSKLGRNTMAWRLAEVEYLLSVANQRLILQRDSKTALAALHSADQQLRSLADPALVPVREAIASEVSALQAVSEPDVVGMVAILNSLTKAVETLPLLDTAPKRPSLEEGAGQKYRDLHWRDLPLAIWQDLKSLVRIRRVDQPAEPLLPPQEEVNLRQNLRLKLEQVKLSLLRGETPLYRQQLATAGEWLTAYFDREASAVQAMQQNLEQLGKVELRPELPDISLSLRLLREQLGKIKVQSPIDSAGASKQ